METFAPLISKTKTIALWIAVLAAIAIALLHTETDLLWKVQQYNLFLYTSLFFKQQIVAPGGFLSYLGSFFTQFFYHPWLGVMMLCGWWLLLMCLLKQTFSVPSRWNIVTLVPIAILLISNMQLGYWIYVMRLPGYFFSSTIGSTISITLLWGFRKLPSIIWSRIGFLAFVVVAGYPLMGAYALMTALLICFWMWRFNKHSLENLIFVIITLVTIAVVPLIYYRYVFYQINIIAIYRAALPDFPFDEEFLKYLIPYYSLAVCFLAFIIMPFQYTPKNNLLKVEQISLLLLIMVGIWCFWYKDENFHHELRMQRCIELTDWEGVLEEGKKQESEPNRAIVMMHNLALNRLGRQCEEMYNFKKGSKLSNTTLPIRMYHKIGRLINYQYGLMNECHRMCMEDGVGLGWNVELLQYMARAALLSNQPHVTRKYLNLLRQTHYYGDWADHIESLIDNPEFREKDKETGPIVHMMQYDDILGEGDGYVEKNLMVMLSKMDSDDPYFQEQAVLAAMWTKNINDFWLRFDKYVKVYRELHSDEYIPRIIQEAVYLFGNVQNLPFVNQLPFSQDVTDGFDGFMYLMQQCQGKPSSWQKDYLYQKYGNTYYYEYFFENNNNYY